ncbi:Methyltransferase [Pandoravirus salinus]|uniref:site-specific DNA-methyltransferase (cytosine-N(4)-specific) n=1 Tax=Pandoravirus salinus TaxID=1349410 RepID=S4VWN6_9VIRU|nr:DNA methyltransferase [Pandoravirus salinus]AGO85064.1 Methyltransferase [Pandoravirus salinus]
MQDCSEEEPLPHDANDYQRSTPLGASVDLIGGAIAHDDRPMSPERRRCVLVNGDARRLDIVDDASVHLVLTSPPYWTLKEYNAADAVEGQLGHVQDYADFLTQLDKVWAECYRVLVPGSRLVVVVGDVLLSRKRHGRHRLVPLHSDIQIACQRVGFDCLAPIIWHKIGSVAHEVNNGRASMLGKPYEPNAIIKNDIEYILMLRKPGGYRSPTPTQRDLSRIPKADFHAWFRQIWTDVPGTRSKDHPAPFPRELAARLVRMFSFDGDTVLDPFAGSGTTLAAALDARRHAVGVEIDPTYFALAKKRIAAALPRIHWRQRHCDPVDNDNTIARDCNDDPVDVHEPIPRDCAADFVPDTGDDGANRACVVGTLAAAGGAPPSPDNTSRKRKRSPPDI